MGEKEILTGMWYWYHSGIVECECDRLHIWQVNWNYKRDNTDTKCQLCVKSKGTTEHDLECEKAKKFTLSIENSKGEWKEITEIYRKENNKKKKYAVTKVQD